MTVQRRVGTYGLMDHQSRFLSGYLENLAAMKLRTVSCKQKANSGQVGLTSIDLMARLSSARCHCPVNKLPLLLTHSQYVLD